MDKKQLLLFLSLLCSALLSAQQKVTGHFRVDIPLDSIQLSDPCILADKKTNMYYMTGTGGLLWKSKDLASWEGPYEVAQTDPASWMGPKPEIWAAELHEYKGKYYYFATFTNNAIKIDTVKGNVIPRRASHVLVSNRPDGPYKPMKDSIYLPSDMPTLNDPWIQEKDPITPFNFGHGMLFQTLTGKWLMSVHSHKEIDGRYVRIPHLFEVDLSTDRLVIKGKFGE